VYCQNTQTLELSVKVLLRDPGLSLKIGTGSTGERGGGGAPRRRRRGV